MARKPRNTQYIIEEARKNVDKWFGWFSTNNTNYRKWTRFILGKQWDAATLDYYQRNGKLTLTLNILYSVVKQIIGEQLQNTPSLKVRAASDNVPQDVLTLREDIIRSIEIESKSKDAYQNAFRCAMHGGYGAFLVATEYDGSDSFDQVARVRPVDEPDTCFWDPLAKDSTKSDGNVCGYMTYMGKEEYEQKYAGKDFDDSFMMREESACNWGDQVKQTIGICHYYRKEHFRKTIVKLTDGTTLEKSELESYLAQWVQQQKAIIKQASMQGQIMFMPRMPEIEDERTSNDYTIMCYKLTRNQLLEWYEWPSKHLPLIYVDGDSTFFEGNQITKSFIENAEDAQRSINFIWSEIIQYIKNARREKLFLTKTQVQGYESIYKNPERQNGYLPYNVDPMVPGPPIVHNPISIPPELLGAFNTAIQELYQIIGRTEAAMGMNGNEVSGKAIDARVTQQNIGSFVQFENLNKGIEQCGRVLNDLITNLYTNERLVTIFNDNEETEQVPVNQPNPMTGQIERDLTVGKYIVQVSVGPSFEAQKRDERDFLLTLIQSGGPQAFALVADKLAALSDSDITPSLVERFKSLVPPAVIAKEEGLPPPPSQPNPELMLQMETIKQKAKESQQNYEIKTQQNQLDAAKIQQQYVSSQLQAMAQADRSGAEIRKAELEVTKAYADAEHKTHKSLVDYGHLFHQLNNPYQGSKKGH